MLLLVLFLLLGWAYAFRPVPRSATHGSGAHLRTRSSLLAGGDAAFDDVEPLVLLLLLVRCVSPVSSDASVPTTTIWVCVRPVVSALRNAGRVRGAHMWLCPPLSLWFGRSPRGGARCADHSHSCSSSLCSPPFVCVSPPPLKADAAVCAPAFWRRAACRILGYHLSVYIYTDRGTEHGTKEVRTERRRYK